MDSDPVPLITEAEQITAQWIQQALFAGGSSATREIAAVEVQQLSDVANALGNLYRCRLIDGDGTAAEPTSVIVKLPSSDAMAFRFSRWLSLHRREYVVLPGHSAARLRAGSHPVPRRLRP